MIAYRRNRRVPWPVRLIKWIALSISDLIRFLLYTAFFIALIVAVSYYLVVRYVTWEKTIPAPDLREMTVEQAVNKVQAEKLSIQQDHRQESNLPAGWIISQIPKPGQEIKTGTPIRVIVSSGTNLIPVPSGLVGDTRQRGAFRLREAQLEEGNVAQVAMPGVAGQTILATDPPAGTGVPKGWKVNLLISSGEAAATRTMPPLIGYTLDQARELLALEGLKAEERIEPRQGATPGKIHTQLPLPGIEIGAQTHIVLIQAPAVGEAAAPRRPPAVGLAQ